MKKRKTKRFQLQLPLSITRSGADRVAFAGLTNDIGSSEVLFTVGHGPDPGGPIEYVITLNQDGQHTTNLRCVGKVLRTDPLPANGALAAFQVAATLERYEFVRDHQPASRR